MKESKEKKEKERKLIILFAFLLFLGSGYFLVLAFEGPDHLARPEEKRLNTSDVNFNLKKTIQKQEVDRVRLETEHFSKLRQIDPRAVRKDMSNHSLELEYDRTQETIANDLRGSSKERRPMNSVDELVQAQLYEDMILRESNLQQREEYARQFIENARRNGVEVKLAPDYSVRSVRRINPIPGAGPGPSRDVSSGGTR